MEESRVICLDASTRTLLIAVTLQVLYKEFALQHFKTSDWIVYYE